MLQARVQAYVQNVNIVATRTFINDVFISRQVRATKASTRRRAKASRFFRITRIITPIKLKSSNCTRSFYFRSTTCSNNSGEEIVRMNIATRGCCVRFIPAARFRFFLNDEGPIYGTVFFRLRVGGYGIVHSPSWVSQGPVYYSRECSFVSLGTTTSSVVVSDFSPFPTSRVTLVTKVGKLWYYYPRISVIFVCSSSVISY